MSYARYEPLRAVIVNAVFFPTASGGTTIVRPAFGTVIVPPSAPIVFDTTMSDESGVARSSGTIFTDVVEPPPSSPPSKSADELSAGATLDFGAAGESAEQAKAVIIAEAASAKVVRERRRIVAILLGF
jgi:hypothetical protein